MSDGVMCVCEREMIDGKLKFYIYKERAQLIGGKLKFIIITGRMLDDKRSIEF